MSAVIHPHIDVDQNGVARFKGTRFKVNHVIFEHTRWKWSAEAIQLQHPELSLAQVHSALAYYYDNQAEVDRDLRGSEQECLELRRQSEDTELQTELRGKLSQSPSQP